MKKCNTIHQLTSQSHSQMMSYVIETKDDKIIVVDGGCRCDAQYLLNYIKELTGGTIQIDAWILTHVHSDHHGAIIEAFENHEFEFNVDKIYYNFPTIELLMQNEPMYSVDHDEFEKCKPKLLPKLQILKDDDVLDFGEAVFKVLYAPDFTIPENFINNTSVVLKMTLSGNTMIFLGDLGVEAGNIMLAKRGEELKSDFVQMAHHGQNGVTFDVYKAINPQVCFWDTPLWLWNNDAGNGYNTHVWQTVIVRGWMDELGIKNHFVTKDGTNKIEL
ncbi:MAG: MBL fold metallo-hydrolase [Oscillospiraceae bacterium]|nr:MBL fold metallo-hydrolase [Oscillospiraceae bacterium]